MKDSEFLGRNSRSKVTIAVVVVVALTKKKKIEGVGEKEGAQIIR